MAEVHFMGQILGGTGFPNTGLICKWGLEASEETWDVLEGFTEGQTHTNWPKNGGKTVWAHPIDVHYQCMVNFYTSSREDRLAGIIRLAEAALPMERFSAFFVGGKPRLLDESVAYTGNDRFRLNTVCSGTVHVRLGCLLRDFTQNGVSTS